MPIGIYPRTEEHRRNIGLAHKGRTYSEEYKKRISETLKRKGIKPPYRKGYHLTEEAKKHLSELNRGDKCNFWKGGTSTFRDRIRNHPKYVQWRQSVFLRDDFTCQECGQRGGRLQTHHIKSFSGLLQEVRENLPLIDLYEAVLIYTPCWDLDNGITLCIDCHKKTKNYGGGSRK